MADWLVWLIVSLLWAVSFALIVWSLASIIRSIREQRRWKRMLTQTPTALYVPATGIFSKSAITLTSTPHTYGTVTRTTKPIKDDGVKLGTLTGYRGFDAERAASGRWVLHSLSMGSPWLPGEVAVARCGIHICDDDLVPEANPKHDPACGIYAYKMVVPMMGEVMAEVELWGRIVEHEYGYRAQYARITALYRTADFVDQIAKDYNVEVRPWVPSENPSERSNTGLFQSQLRLQAARYLLQHLHQHGLTTSQPPPDNDVSKG